MSAMDEYAIARFIRMRYIGTHLYDRRTQYDAYEAEVLCTDGVTRTLYSVTWIFADGRQLEGSWKAKRPRVDVVFDDKSPPRSERHPPPPCIARAV